MSDIRPISTTPRPIQCGECGMILTSWAEYHPLTACQLYAVYKNAQQVRAELELPAVKT